MSDIKTWHQRAMAHPDHQSGMISEDMIRARMCEEIDDLRAEIERLRAEIKRLRTDRRERIATAALQGILACQEGNTALPKEWPGIFAIMSVGCADALIAELDKEEGKP